MKKPGFVQDYSMDVGGFSRQVAAVGGALGGGKNSTIFFFFFSNG